MEDEIGKCYILRKKHVPHHSYTLALKKTENGQDIEIMIVSPAEHGIYTLYEELSADMKHVRWIWDKEED